MAYFPDLSEYTYMQCRIRPGLVNVGWLDRAHVFTTGALNEPVLERLWQFCRASVVHTRGSHGCEFCQPPHRGLLSVTRGAETLKLSSAEIRVFRADGRVYAAPDLIYHYVTQHGYCPPPEFVSAMLECPLPETEDYLQLWRTFLVGTDGTLLPDERPYGLLDAPKCDRSDQ